MTLKKKIILASLSINLLLMLSGCGAAAASGFSTETLSDTKTVSSTEALSDTEAPSSTNTASSCKRQMGTVVTIPDFYSPQLGTDDNVLRIYLPYGYESSTQSYPVIYMPDGQNLFSSTTATYGKAWCIGVSIDTMRMAGKTDGIIVVGIDAPSNRTKAYNLYLDSYEGGGSGLANATSDFYADTVKPYIDENYRTLSDREHTAILGSSYGAIVSFNTALRHSELFGSIGMFSYCDNQAPKQMTDFLKENMTDEALGCPSIYFFTGNYDFARESTLLAYQIASENDMEHICLEEDENGEHDEYTWSDHFEDCLSFWGWINDGQ